MCSTLLPEPCVLYLHTEVAVSSSFRLQRTVAARRRSLQVGSTPNANASAACYLLGAILNWFHGANRPSLYLQTLRSRRRRSASCARWPPLTTVTIYHTANIRHACSSFGQGQTCKALDLGAPERFSIYCSSHSSSGIRECSAPDHGRNQESKASRYRVSIEQQASHARRPHMGPQKTSHPHLSRQKCHSLQMGFKSNVTSSDSDESAHESTPCRHHTV